MLIHFALVFVGAFLLFLVQPMLGRFLLPRFGGGAAVWTACLVFFQSGLFCGYLYAHVLGRLAPRKQLVLHGTLLAGAAFAFGGLEGFMESPAAGPELPFWGIQAALFWGIGLPYLLLGATAPLVQRWLEHARPEAPAYRLYGVSNLASFSALCLYPVWIEPSFSRVQQAGFFRLGLFVFVLLLVLCGVGSAKQGNEAEGDGEPEGQGVSSFRSLGWWCYPALSSAWLVTISQSISENVPPMPFLWALFLALYLASYACAFQGWKWVDGPALRVLLLTFTGVVAHGHYVEQDASYGTLLGSYAVLFFSACCVLHGRIYQLRPRRSGDSTFYLALAGGGAAGGLAVALLAPALFATWLELPLLMLVTLAVVAFRTIPRVGPSRRIVGAIAGAAWIAAGAYLFVQERALRSGARVLGRNAYGVHAVYELDAGNSIQHRLELTSGTTAHGWQYQTPEYRREPSAYFTRQSGVGRALRAFPADRGLHIGVVGLGAGVLAAYGKPTDRMRFYEIDPKVVSVARETFTFLADSPAAIEVLSGDARIVLEAEADMGFDLLVLDAFSSDSIPVHLLTRECFETYLRHLQPDGMIAVHVSSRYLDLVRPLAVMSKELALPGVWISQEVLELAALPSTWVLLSRNRALLSHPTIAEAGVSLRDVRRPTRLWTDEHQALFEVLAWNRL